MADWVAISSLATAGGTLALAGTTYASVRSANRAARAAEVSMLATLRPLLLPSGADDPPQRIGFVDGVGVTAPGRARFYPERRPGSRPAPLEEFRLLTRDLYIPPGKVGFWQGAFRDEADPDREVALAAIEHGEFGVDVLHGDYEGGQRVVTRFGCQREDDGSWTLAAGRHWQIDRENPR